MDTAEAMNALLAAGLTREKIISMRAFAIVEKRLNPKITEAKLAKKIEKQFNVKIDVRS